MGVCGFLVVLFVSMFLGTGLVELKPILVDVGSDSSTDPDGRNWMGDLVPGENFSLSSPGIVASVAAISTEEPFYEKLLKTARIFNTTSLYTFRVSPGSYFLRLHFRPFPFGVLDANKSAFDVKANDMKLVSSFSVPGELSWKRERSNSNDTFIAKEYFLNVQSNDLLIEFRPVTGSFAFVNAIEVLPVLDKIFHESADKVEGNGVESPMSLVNLGMETMYRLNVGLPEDRYIEETDLLRGSDQWWREWRSDEKYMFSSFAGFQKSNTSNISYSSNDYSSAAAPLQIYETARITTNSQVVEKRFNMSWKFDVDPDFDYLVRLHFCELMYERPHQRVFRIYINNKTAALNYDVFVKAGGKNKAYHEDYVESISPHTDTIWLQLGPDPSTSAPDTDALLSGLEIFKLSRNANLAHLPERIATKEVELHKKKSNSLWAVTAAGVIAVVAVIIVCIVFIRSYIHKKKNATTVKENPPEWRPLSLHGVVGSPTDARVSRSALRANGSLVTSRMGRMFTLAEIRHATRNFDESLVIGHGGFGRVYRGEIEEGALVAIKRANPESEQGLTEFETEIEMLSKLRHRHLVSMIGYCDEQNEMILVYEYMANGTLRSHLFGSDLPPLTWKQRLEMCIGAARGLHYLHTGLDRGIIHRDIKTTNILLDENYVAKMADFGLSKTGPALDHTHVSTAVKGSFGYLDPEYFRRQQLTEKSDVYSFGVVLFEVVCARPVINPTLPKDEVNIAEWGLKWQRQQLLENIVDAKLEKNYSLESLKKFGEIAEKCLADEGRNRPTMGEVLWHLEYVLQLHEAYMRAGVAESFTATELTFANMSFTLPRIKEEEEASCSAAVRLNRSSEDPMLRDTN